MSNTTIFEVLKQHLCDKDMGIVIKETERQEKGRWELYKNTRCETLRMALCYLLDPKKALPEHIIFYNQLLNK